MSTRIIPINQEINQADVGSLSYAGEISCSYKWTISDFKNRRLEKASLTSDVFQIYEPDGRISTWRLLLYLKGDTNTQDGNLSIYLKSLNSFKITVSFTLSVLDESTGTKRNSFKAKDHKFLDTQGYGWHSFCKENTIENNPQWLDDDKLTLVCDIMLSHLPNNKVPLSRRRLRQLCQDLSDLFKDETTTDVKIKCGTKIFPCHRAILSARSPVFRAMLKTDMEESRDGIVEITDFGPKVVEDMLRFIYTSQEISINLHQDQCRDHIAELMKASDKYNLGLLKEACEEALCLGLEVENCLISLILADMYRAKELKKCSMKIFVENMNKVIKGSDDWKKCVKNHPDLTVEITEEIARRQCTYENIDISAPVSQGPD